MKALTDREQRLLLEGTDNDETLRDHVLFALALGTGLRVFELVALNVDTVFDGQNIKEIISLDPKHTKGRQGGKVVIPRKHHRAIRLLCERRESDPLFVSRGGGRSRAKSGSRLSKRGAQTVFRSWQQRLGFKRRCNFHMLRYTFCWNFWRSIGGGGDLRAVQQAARHTHMMLTAEYVMVAAGISHSAIQKAWLNL